MGRRAGRRPGNQDTRGAIVEAARHAFGERGYAGTTIRQVAAAAGVDPALIHHYFGTKDDLFLAVLELPVDPVELLAEAVTADRSQAGEQLVRAFLSSWDSPVGSAAAALLRSVVDSPMTAQLFRDLVFRRIAAQLERQLGIPADEAPLRTSLIASQMAGLAMTRYLVRIEPLASAPPAVVIAAIAPTIQRYLDGDLPTDA